MEQIRIPKSAARRGAVSYAKLLYQVTSPADSGFAYEGKLLRPGSRMEESELWPAPDWPRTPVVLECAGSAGGGWGHRRAPLVYILWRYESGGFVEVARTAALDASWAADLAAAARRSMEAPAPPGVDLDAIEERVVWMLEIELGALTGTDRSAVLNVVHDELATRIAAAV